MANQQDTGLTQGTQAKICKVLDSVPVLEKAILYGSRAMGTYRSGSDIDLTLKGKRLEWQDLQRLEVALDDLLLPYQFDLSLYHQIDNPSLIAHITRVGLLFYQRDDML